MTFEPKIDKATKERIVEMWRDGKKVPAITAETGVSKSSIYYILSKLEVTPRRKPGPKPNVDALEVPALLEIIREKDELILRQQEEIGRLKERVRKRPV